MKKLFMVQFLTNMKLLMCWNENKDKLESIKESALYVRNIKYFFMFRNKKIVFSDSKSHFSIP